jgi:SPP1 family predicted phage head-tail adaptor
MTQIGALDKRIVLQAQLRVPDGLGGFNVSWASVLPAGTTLAAAVWPISAIEQVRSGAVTMVGTHRVRIWFRSVMKASWRVFYNGRYFSIVSLTDPSESHEFIEMLCKEVVT